MSPLLLQIQDQSDYNEVIPLITSHLQSRTDSLDRRFPSLSHKRTTGLATVLLGSRMQEEEQLGVLQRDRTLEMKFNEVTLDVF
jgi:hypothetical protein